MRRVLLLPLLLALCGFLPWGQDTPERRAATRYILEKLERQSGPGWERAGQYFNWNYGFDRSGCELRVERREVYGQQFYREDIPIATVAPTLLGDSHLRLVCLYDAQCIGFAQRGPEVNREGALGDTRLMVPDPNDLPKLLDAFNELHRLCDDPYRSTPRLEE